MSIFKREQDPPYNRAAASRAPAPPAPAGVPKEPAPPPPQQRAQPPAVAPSGDSVAALTTAGIESPVDRSAAAVVDRQTEITGTLHSAGNVLIEGRFHGEVEAHETVWVEQGAQSDGQLRASAAVISGAVDGQIDCERRLHIAAGAAVQGEIKTPILVIEDGATVNCRFSMMRPNATYGGIR